MAIYIDRMVQTQLWPSCRNWASHWRVCIPQLVGSVERNQLTQRTRSHHEFAKFDPLVLAALAERSNSKRNFAEGKIMQSKIIVMNRLHMLGLAMLAALLLPAAAAAQSAPPAWESGKWEYAATIYGWVPTIDGKVNYAGDSFLGLVVTTLVFQLVVGD